MICEKTELFPSRNNKAKLKDRVFCAKMDENIFFS